MLAKSVTPSRIDENRTLVKLDSSDMDALEDIHKKKGITRYVFPPFGVSIGSQPFSAFANHLQPKLGFPDTEAAK